MYKSSKSELAQILKTYRPKVPSEISGAKILSVLIIDFMAYIGRFLKYPTTQVNKYTTFFFQEFRKTTYLQ